MTFGSLAAISRNTKLQSGTCSPKWDGFSVRLFIVSKQENERELGELLSLLAHAFHVLFSVTTPELHIVEEDPHDDKFIECAVALRADFVISGGKALTGIQDYMGIRIVTPGEFIDGSM